MNSSSHKRYLTTKEQGFGILVTNRDARLIQPHDPVLRMENVRRVVKEKGPDVKLPARGRSSSLSCIFPSKTPAYMLPYAAPPETKQ